MNEETKAIVASNLTAALVTAKAATSQPQPTDLSGRVLRNALGTESPSFTPEYVYGIYNSFLDLLTSPSESPTPQKPKMAGLENVMRTESLSGMAEREARERKGGGDE